MNVKTEQVMDAYYRAYGDEDFIVYPQDIGKTLQNLIATERGKVLDKAVAFTLDYIRKNFQ